MVMARNWRAQLLTILYAGLGVAAFEFLSLPLPWLLGPMFFCLLAAGFRAPLKGLPPVSEAMRTVLGVAVGASITPALFGRIGDMALSLMLVPIFIVLIGLVGVPFFRRVCGLDRVTSFYAAMPGGFQDMVLFGEEAGGDVRALSLIHATRVLVIVSAVPVLLAWVWQRDLDARPGLPLADVSPFELAVMVACAVVGWWGARRIGLFGAAILGPLVLTTAASLAGLIHARPPFEAILAAQFFIGIGVGVKYEGITLDEVRRVVLAGLGFCVLLAGLAVAFTELVVVFGLAPPVDALLSFAPGGQAEMAVLAIVAGADMGFVVAHHLTRLVVVILGAPLVAPRKV